MHVMCACKSDAVDKLFGWNWLFFCGKC